MLEELEESDSDFLLPVVATGGSFTCAEQRLNDLGIMVRRIVQAELGQVKSNESKEIVEDDC